MSKYNKYSKLYPKDDQRVKTIRLPPIKLITTDSEDESLTLSRANEVPQRVCRVTQAKREMSSSSSSLNSNEDFGEFKVDISSANTKQKNPKSIYLMRTDSRTNVNHGTHFSRKAKVDDDANRHTKITRTRSVDKDKVSKPETSIKSRGTQEKYPSRSTRQSERLDSTARSHKEKRQTDKTLSVNSKHSERQSDRNYTSASKTTKYSGAKSHLESTYSIPKNSQKPFKNHYERVEKGSCSDRTKRSNATSVMSTRNTKTKKESRDEPVTGMVASKNKIRSDAKSHVESKNSDTKNSRLPKHFKSPVERDDTGTCSDRTQRSNATSLIPARKASTETEPRDEREDIWPTSQTTIYSDAKTHLESSNSGLQRKTRISEITASKFLPQTESRAERDRATVSSKWRDKHDNVAMRLENTPRANSKLDLQCETSSRDISNDTTTQSNSSKSDIFVAGNTNPSVCLESKDHTMPNADGLEDDCDTELSSPRPALKRKFIYASDDSASPSSDSSVHSVHWRTNESSGQGSPNRLRSKRMSRRSQFLLKNASVSLKEEPQNASISKVTRNDKMKGKEKRVSKNIYQEKVSDRNSKTPENKNENIALKSENLRAQEKLAKSITNKDQVKKDTHKAKSCGCNSTVCNDSVHKRTTAGCSASSQLKFLDPDITQKALVSSNHDFSDIAFCSESLTSKDMYPSYATICLPSTEDQSASTMPEAPQKMASKRNLKQSKPLAIDVLLAPKPPISPLESDDDKTTSSESEDSTSSLSIAEIAAITNRLASHKNLIESLRSFFDKVSVKAKNSAVAHASAETKVEKTKSRNTKSARSKVVAARNDKRPEKSASNVAMTSNPVNSEKFMSVLVEKINAKAAQITGTANAQQNSQLSRNQNDNEMRAKAFGAQDDVKSVNIDEQIGLTGSGDLENTVEKLLEFLTRTAMQAATKQSSKYIHSGDSTMCDSSTTTSMFSQDATTFCSSYTSESNSVQYTISARRRKKLTHRLKKNAVKLASSGNSTETETTDAYIYGMTKACAMHVGLQQAIKNGPMATNNNSKNVEATSLCHFPKLSSKSTGEVNMLYQKESLLFTTSNEAEKTNTQTTSKECHDELSNNAVDDSKILKSSSTNTNTSPISLDQLLKTIKPTVDLKKSSSVKLISKVSLETIKSAVDLKKSLFIHLIAKASLKTIKPAVDLKKSSSLKLITKASLKTIKPIVDLKNSSSAKLITEVSLKTIKPIVDLKKSSSVSPKESKNEEHNYKKRYNMVNKLQARIRKSLEKLDFNRKPYTCQIILGNIRKQFSLSCINNSKGTKTKPLMNKFVTKIWKKIDKVVVKDYLKKLKELESGKKPSVKSRLKILFHTKLRRNNSALLSKILTPYESKLEMIFENEEFEPNQLAKKSGKKSKHGKISRSDKFKSDKKSKPKTKHELQSEQKGVNKTESAFDYDDRASSTFHLNSCESDINLRKNLIKEKKEMKRHELETSHYKADPKSKVTKHKREMPFVGHFAEGIYNSYCDGWDLDYSFQKKKNNSD